MLASYYVVFDITKDAQPDSLIEGRLIASIFVIIGVLMWFNRRHLPWLFRIIFPVGFTTLGLLCLGGLVFRHPLQPSELAAAFRGGKCSVVEGAVTEFDPMPANGHGLESFVVSGKHFEYSDYIITPGFHQTTLHGGPIRDGLRVRIYYLGSDIAKLEVAHDEASNQAMQRTAGRSVFSLSMTSTSNLQRRAPSPAVADLVAR